MIMSYLDLPHIFLLITALLVFGNIAMKLRSNKRSQFMFNSAILILLTVVIGSMLLSGTTTSLIAVLWIARCQEE